MRRVNKSIEFFIVPTLDIVFSLLVLISKRMHLRLLLSVSISKLLLKCEFAQMNVTYLLETIINRDKIEGKRYFPPFLSLFAGMLCAFWDLGPASL